MNNLLMAILVFSSLSAVAGDIKCANKDARAKMTDVLNYHRANAGLAPVNEKEIFLQKIDLDGEVKEFYPTFKTTKELSDAILASTAAQEVGELITLGINYPLVMRNAEKKRWNNSEKELQRPLTEKFCLDN